MSDLEPPFDDTVQLEIMPIDFNDTEPIIAFSDTTASSLADPTDEHQDKMDNGHSISRRRAFIATGILFFINLINYMDRFTIAGVLNSVEKYYGITDSSAGLLQTTFICSYMVFSPIFGYMGDRYTRKFIMAFGIFMWSGVTLGGSFVDSDHYYAFIILRAMVGIGEASYSTIAPTIIADLFSKELRSKMLMVFYFAIPVGSGLGYIVGSEVAAAFHHWQYALRVTPFLGILSVLLILLLVPEPPRGMSEGGSHVKTTSYLTDLKEILKVKTFTLSTLGVTCVAFSTGALAFFAPQYIQRAITSRDIIVTQADVSFKFGIITCAAGFLGVGIGVESARRYKKINPRADAIICAIGMIMCAPFLYFSLILSRIETIPTWILIFIGETLLCLNWAVTADILLYVIVPTRRSTAEAVQILTSHALGDAISPYLVGIISDTVKKQQSYHGYVSPQLEATALQYALFTTAFICVLGGGFYLASALFLERDKNNADRLTKLYSDKSASVDSSEAISPTDDLSSDSGIQPRPI